LPKSFLLVDAAASPAHPAPTALHMTSVMSPHLETSRLKVKIF